MSLLVLGIRNVGRTHRVRTEPAGAESYQAEEAQEAISSSPMAVRNQTPALVGKYDKAAHNGIDTSQELFQSQGLPAELDLGGGRRPSQDS